MTLATEPMPLEAYLDYDDGTETRYELANGVLVEIPAETPLNKTIAMFLVSYFMQLGIPYYRLATGHQMEISSEKATVRDPDLVVHTEASAAATLSDGRLLRQGQPDPLLVVEVVSNSNKDRRSYQRDYVEKRCEYAKRGIPEYWIVDPAMAVVYVFCLEAVSDKEQCFAGHSSIESPTFPSFDLTAAQILSAGL
ncbi:MAG: Uma2 family endonuclease [Cyanobacteria bacterium P01_D01_bin.14]